MKQIKSFLFTLFLILLVGVTASAALANPVLNEFMANPADGEQEWIELYNPTTETISLEGWTLHDSVGEKYVFTTETIEPFGFVVIYDDSLGLNDASDDTITLYDNESNSIDSVTYGDGAEPLAANAVDNESFARIADGSSWSEESVAASTPGTDNANNAPVFISNFVEFVDENGTLTLTTDDLVFDPDSDTLTIIIESTSSDQVTVQNNSVVFSPDFTFVSHPETTENVFANISIQDEDTTIEEEFTIIVNDVNQNPELVSLGGQLFSESVLLEFTEGVENTYSVVVQDADGDNVSFVTLLSEPSGMTLDVDSGEITWLPQEVIDLDEVGIVIEDELGAQDEQYFNVTVTPAVEILAVTVNGVESDNVSVVAGQDVTLDVTYKNNLGSILGNVEVSASSDPADILLETIDDFFLGSEGSASFDFTVPTLVGDEFVVSLIVSDDTLSGEQFTSPEKNITFTVTKQEAALSITNATLEDSVLACSKSSTLDVEVANVGQFDLTPEIWVLADHSETFALQENGDIVATLEDNVVGVIRKDQSTSISVGTSETFSIDIDASTQPSVTEFTVYVVNPFFKSSESDSPVGAFTTVTVDEFSACLNTAQLESALSSSSSSTDDTSVDLLSKENDEFVYLATNDGQASSLAFSISEQSNEDLVSCAISNSELTCSPQQSNVGGSSTITVSIEDTDSGSVINETFTVTRTSTLQISSVTLNAVSVSEEGNSTTVNPGDSVTISFTVTNGYDTAITGIVSNVDIPGVEIVSSESSFNLNSGASQTVTVTGTVSHTVTEGEYSATLSVEGDDFNDLSTHTDIFPFTLVVAQEAADLTITALTLADENGIVCAASTDLSVELTNAGKNAEDDVTLTISGADLLIEENVTDSIDANSQYTQTFTIPATNISTGSNTLTVTITYRDGFKQDSESISVSKQGCLAGTTPSESSLTLLVGETQEFTANSSDTATIEWFVAKSDEDYSAVPSGTGTSFTFDESEPATYSVKVILNGDETEAREWTIVLTNVPLDLADFGWTESISDASFVENFIVTKNGITVAFTEAVDLSGIMNLADVITLQKVSSNEARITINSSAAPGLNKQATITVSSFASGNTAFYTYDGSISDKQVCSECSIVSHNQDLVFTVNGFSTVQAINEEEANLVAPNSIQFEQVDSNTTASAEITLENTGTSDTLTNVVCDISGLDSAYSASLSGCPSSISAGSQVTATLSITNSQNSGSGSNIDLGDIVITSDQNNASIDVFLQEKSFLEITDIDVNDDGDNGDLVIDDVNDIKIEVTNNYFEDMEDVEVTVTLKDIDDGDDEDESEDIGDLDVGDDDDITVEFDLTKYDITDETFVMEILVEAEAKDGTDHTVTVERTLDLDLESHKLEITSAKVTQSVLQCSRQTKADIEVTNFGKDEEDEVRLTIQNSALGISLEKDELEIKEFTDDDNEETFTFSLDLSSAKPGTYTFDVEVFRDEDNQEDSATFTVDVQDCLTSSSSSQQQQTSSDGKTTTVKLLEDRLGQQTTTVATTQSNQKVTSSFRDSSAYVGILAAFALLIIVAIILAIAVIARKPKRRY